MNIRKSFVATLLISAGVLAIHWTVVPVSGTLAFEDQSELNLSLFETGFSYFILLACTLFFPLILSFDQRVHYVGKWKYLLVPFLMISLPYIIWDVLFTQWGIWGFNEAYVSGIYIFSLPLEELLFFIVIPFACIFIYECVRSYGISQITSTFSKWLIRLIAACAFICLILFWDRYYTFAAGLLAVLMILYAELQLRKSIRDNIYATILLSFIPFVMINGVLTGIATQEPIVVYNMEENMGFRFFSIPLEDFIYQTALMAAMLITYRQARAIQIGKEI